MLWFGDVAIATLRAQCGTAFARSGFSAPPFSWAALGEILSQEPDVLVVRSGRLVERAAPHDLATLMQLLATGDGVVVRRAENQHPDLKRLCEKISAVLGRAATVQIFATAANTHGFGWHYDAEEVFIWQCQGRKCYLLRANTLEPEGRIPPPPGTDVTRERTPVMKCELGATDVIYLPKATWHMAECIETSLSISLGIR